MKIKSVMPGSGKRDYLSLTLVALKEEQPGIRSFIMWCNGQPPRKLFIPKRKKKIVAEPKYLDPDTNKLEDFFKNNLCTDWTLDNIKELLFILLGILIAW